jgi:hypothetical protein
MATLNSTTAASLNDICGVDVYGENATVSGLMMFPLTANATSLAPGTMKGVVYCHGTETDSWPSIDFLGINQTSLEIAQFVALASLGGSVIILPDYLGFGASMGQVHKAHFITKAYQTAVIPLWYQAQYILAQESNCSSVLGNQAAVVGYSEGGYAAVAVSQGLTKAGVKLIHVDSGGAPFRVSSAVILSNVGYVDADFFPIDLRFILAIFGSAYSGTYPLPNSNQTNQYMLATSFLDEIVKLVTDSASAESLNAVIPANDTLSIFNQQYVTLARDAIAQGDSYPCTNSSSNFSQVLGLFCDALLPNDLTDYLETQVNYPVRLCHSKEDNVVAYANMPDISKNPKYLTVINGIIGDHLEAGAECLFQALKYLLSPAFQNYVVPNETQPGGCPTPVTSTPAKPTAPPTKPPSSPSSGTAPRDKHTTVSIALALTVILSIATLLVV